MNVKTTNVTLQVGELRKDFEKSHAERILRMPNNGGWRLPANSKFELHEKNGLITRSNKKDTGKSKEEGGNIQSNPT